MNAAHTVNVKQRKLVNFSALESSPLMHRNTSPLTSVDYRRRRGGTSIVL
jgi:hypothetical protein